MKRPLSYYLLVGLFHLVATFLVTVGVIIFTIGIPHFSLLFHAMGTSLNWTTVVLQFGLGACVWAFTVITIQMARTHWLKRRVIAIKKATGTALTEFLIILVPYLLLTSGLAQLTQLNITSLLCDVAAYEAARSAWIWGGDLRSSRAGIGNDPRVSTGTPGYVGAYGVSTKALISAASVLTPTAPGDFHVGKTNGWDSEPDAMAQRAIMVGMFDTGNINSLWMKTGGSTGYVYGETSIHQENMDENFLTALDTKAFYLRAARKFTFAEMALRHGGDVHLGGGECSGGGICSGIQLIGISPYGPRQGMRFAYPFEVAFPWFGYIWGDFDTIAGRRGYFTVFRREHTFAAMPNWRDGSPPAPL